MKRLAAALCLVTGLALASCSDSGDDVLTPVAADAAPSAKDGGSNDASSVESGVTGDTAGPDASGELVCTGLAAKPTRAQLTADVTMGKCMAPSDLDAICSNDLVLLTSNCGGLSYVKLRASSDAGADFVIDEAALRTATLMCVKTLLDKAVVTDDCLSCYGSAVTCTLAHCANVCLPDPNNPTCRPCQLNSGCGAMLYACSGLPAPPSGPDGGAGDGGGTPDGSSTSADGGAPDGSGAADASDSPDGAADTASSD
jgi:hypothetical protein